MVSYAGFIKYILYLFCKVKRTGFFSPILINLTIFVLYFYLVHVVAFKRAFSCIKKIYKK